MQAKSQESLRGNTYVSGESLRSSAGATTSLVYLIGVIFLSMPVIMLALWIGAIYLILTAVFSRVLDWVNLPGSRLDWCQGQQSVSWRK